MGSIKGGEKKLEALEMETQYSSDVNDVPPQDVFAYNELRSCADLFRMHETGVLKIQPDYQREIVWKPSDQSRFIDSLVKELPIPSMCFSMDPKTQTWQVIDGLQRMATIIRFLGDSEWVISKLKDIDPRISNETVASIRRDCPALYRTVENLTLPITILRCDLSKRDHMEYIFTIFHRLNTGGLKLSNQEIRNAIFQGRFNDLLKELNTNVNWISLVGRADGKTANRFQNIELILRFFSFLDESSNYKGGLVSFLNEYMRVNRLIDQADSSDKKKIFLRTVTVAVKVYKRTRSYRLSNVVLDALLYGIAKNINYLEKCSSEKLHVLFKVFKRNAVFSTEQISEGTLQKAKVLGRLKVAANIFAE